MPAAGPALDGAGTPRGAGGEDVAARYRDWAARLRAARPGPPGREAREPAPAPAAGYWSTEALFAESRRIEQEEARSQPDPGQVSELLAVLDLTDGASRAEIGQAYRRLVKEHHPDRHAAADARSRAHHAAEIRRVIDAYRALRRHEA